MSQNKLGKETKEFMYEISEKYDFNILEMEVDKDHLHIMFERQPKLSPLQIIRVLKQQSTQLLWKQHDEFLIKPFDWWLLCFHNR
jgi:putative transposase